MAHNVSGTRNYKRPNGAQRPEQSRNQKRQAAAAAKRKAKLLEDDDDDSVEIGKEIGGQFGGGSQLSKEMGIKKCLKMSRRSCPTPEKYLRVKAIHRSQYRMQIIRARYPCRRSRKSLILQIRLSDDGTSRLLFSFRYFDTSVIK